MGLELYTDGGCCKKNPSPYGIAWAFCVVETFIDGSSVLIAQESGSLTTAQCGKFLASNNLAEMIAAVKGLEYVERVFPSQGVVLCTDSELTKNRLTKGYSLDKLPKNVQERADRVAGSLGLALSSRLVGGHPTKKELKAGFNKKGLPVSEFNVLVDKLCKEECKKLLEIQKD